MPTRELPPESVFMRFTKMHGVGNDYVYVDCFQQKFPAIRRFSCSECPIGTLALAATA